MQEPKGDLKEKIDIALEIYKDISRQIQFADTKAGLILAWHGASLGFLSKIILDAYSSLNPSFGSVVLILYLASLILAGLSIGFAFFVVYPRLEDKKCSNEEKKCMFWAYHISCEGFKSDVKRFVSNLESQDNILNCIARSTVSVAKILQEKYEKLHWSMKFLGLAGICEMLTLLALFFLKVCS